MHEEAWILSLLVFGPAVFALMLLLLAIFLLISGAKKREANEGGLVMTVAGVVLLTGCLGIGACYGVMFLG